MEHSQTRIKNKHDFGNKITKMTITRVTWPHTFLSSVDIFLALNNHFHRELDFIRLLWFCSKLGVSTLLDVNHFASLIIEDGSPKFFVTDDGYPEQTLYDFEGNMNKEIL